MFLFYLFLYLLVGFSLAVADSVRNGNYQPTLVVLGWPLLITASVFLGTLDALGNVIDQVVDAATAFYFRLRGPSKSRSGKES